MFDKPALRPAATCARSRVRGPLSFMLEPPSRREAGGSCLTIWSPRSEGVWTGDIGDRCARTWVTLLPLSQREPTLPWSQITVKDQREEFTRLARQSGANVSELCRRFDISRKTGYKWLSRDDLEDRSRRPHSCPQKMPAAQEALVVAVRAQHPAWGARKIARVLQREHGVQMATSTANSSSVTTREAN